MYKIAELKKRLEELSFNLPKNIFFEEKKNGIRVCSKKLMNIKIKGSRGFIAYNGELTHPFIMTFGKFSSKKLNLSDEEFLLVGEAKPFPTSKEGEYIAFYKGFPVCLVKIKEGKAFPLIGKGFKRKVKTKLND